MTERDGFRPLYDVQRERGRRGGDAVEPVKYESKNTYPGCELPYIEDAEEAEMIKAKEYLLNLYSFIDALIEKSNHNTVITI
uniref:Uncharacterized protein n=1 Tax=viral metagenome TaxID=1070528 RepID=A0A6M3LXJ2_9ZZZZ